MVRVFLVYLLPLVLPALAYLAWYRLQRRRVEAGTRAEALPPVEEAPWLALAAVGVALALMAAVALAFIDGNAPAGSRYEPPHLEDGKVVPGRLR
ncbi:MAG: DUF6111 family protein [Alphaproteobacteria bacterium]|nr:DUF6111 family protein [Alphaproteobacteria bacterium]